MRLFKLKEKKGNWNRALLFWGHANAILLFGMEMYFYVDDQSC